MSQSLSPLEAIMWRAGQDPTLRMTVGSLVILDRPPNLEELIDRLTLATQIAPRLRCRLDDPSRGNTRPAWVDIPDFDASVHVRALAVAEPGSDRQVLDLVSLVEASSFEVVRSPWDVTMIHGLEGGRAGLYLRADHVLTHGFGGTELADLLLDQTRTVVVLDEPAAAAPPDAPPPTSQRRPGTLTVTVDLTTIARPVAAGIGAARGIDPIRTAARSVQRGVEMVRSVSKQLAAPGGALSTLTPSGSLATHFEVVSVPGARAAALRLGGSRNVLLVAAVAAGLGAYHERHGQPVAELRLAAPILVRGPKSGAGNSFSPLRVEIPVRRGHAGAHFGVVADRLARARREPARQLIGPLATTINLLPARALLSTLRAQIGTVDFVATAVPGQRRFGTICGAAIQVSFPFGPRAGRLVNVTALGNGESLDLGIALDPVAIPDPDVFVECLDAAFATLVDDGGPPSVEA